MNFIDDGQGSARDGCFMIFLLPTTAVHVDTFSHLWSIINFENLIFCGHNYPEFFDDEQLKGSTSFLQARRLEQIPLISNFGARQKPWA